MDERAIRKIFSEITAGYSLSKLNNDTIFIKHFSSIDLLEFDFAYQNYLKYYKTRGIPTEEERISLLKRDELWNDGKEKSIKELKDYVSNLHDDKKNYHTIKDITFCNQRIKESSDKLHELLIDKYTLIGDCAENIARRKTDLEQVFGSFYKDKKFENLVFGKDVQKDILDSEIESLIQVYNAYNSELSDENIRKVCVSSEFQIMFSLTENLYHFFGRAIAGLTHFQLKLVNIGTYFKSILNSGQKVPNDIQGNPEAIEDWFFARTNLQKLIEKNESESGVVSIVGMSKKELEYLGVDVGGGGSKKSMKQAATEGGGEISMDEMIKLGRL